MKKPPNIFKQMLGQVMRLFAKVERIDHQEAVRLVESNGLRVHYYFQIVQKIQAKRRLL